MSPLRLLWVNGSTTGVREAWIAAFATVCQLHEIGVSELASQQASGDWDLVCFNFDYPEMASLRLIPDTKKRWPSAPILMLTMQCSLELAVWALRTRVFDLLIKPITEQEIERCMQRVQEAVRARRSQSERRPPATLAQMPAEALYRPQTAPITRLQLALSHVNKHYACHLSESEVAHLCEMSPSRFCREFKAAFGVTFVDHLSQRRICAAKRLLANRSMSVTDVAAAVGFTDPSYFTRVFRKLEGVSPTLYRERSTAPDHLANEDLLRMAVDL
jgi:YesN/AraC family two-component response regulator